MSSTSPLGDIPALKATVDSLWSAAIQPATRASYHSGLQCFRRFTSMNNLGQSYSQNSFIIITEEVLLLFVAHCVKNLHLSYHTIKLYLAGIRFSYLQAGYPNPLQREWGTPYQRLPIILRAVKKSQSPAPPTRLPIDSNILSLICTALRAGVFGPFLDLMLETACTMAFFGFLRCGEFTILNQFDPNVNLCLQDISFQQGRCTIKLKASKTDPFRQGVMIPLFQRQHTICPVRTLKRYYNIRCSTGACLNDPLLVTSEGKPLSRDTFISKLKTIIKQLGLDESRYSGHSLRVGAATAASNARIEDHLIKTLGRWSSDCYTRYVRTSDKVIKDAQNALIP
jgi:hypothetical protein